MRKPKPRPTSGERLLKIDPEIHDFVYCPRCTGDIGWPKSLTEAGKRGFAEMRRREDLSALAFAERTFSLGPREAKALYLHITREPGKCLRCGHPIEGTVSCCAHCHSANLDW